MCTCSFPIWPVGHSHGFLYHLFTTYLHSVLVCTVSCLMIRTYTSSAAHAVSALLLHILAGQHNTILQTVIHIANVHLTCWSLFHGFWYHLFTTY